MRLLAILMTLGLLASCGSTTSERTPASTEMKEPVCKVSKHAKKDWYRLEVNGEPHKEWKSWYTMDQANTHMKIWTNKGMCK